MQIDWWTLGLQTFNVVILIALLSRLLFRPVAAMVAARQQAARDLLAQAEAERQAAAGEREQMAAERQAMAARREELLQAAAQEAAGQRELLLAEARSQLEQLRRQEQDNLLRERQQQQHQLEQQAGELALNIARRLLQRLPAPAIDSFRSGLCEKLAGLPASERAAFGLQPATLRSAHPLSAEALESLRAALQQAAGCPLTLTLEVCPPLLAGLELDNGQTVLRNHLAADLARLQQELNLERSDDAR